MLCHQALLPSAAVWGLGKLWWGEPKWGHPPHLHWGCHCCCDLLKHQGLIRQVAKCIRSCWASRVLPPAWLYNHLSIKQPHFGVWGRLWGDFFGICPCMCIMLFDSSLPVQMCAWLQHAHPSWPICLGVKDEPNHRFGVLGLTSNLLAAVEAPALFLVLRREKKTQPCLICSCNSSWSGMNCNQVFMWLYTPIPTVCTQSYKKEKKRHFKILSGFKKACLNCKKYWTSARDFGIWVKTEIPLQDLLHYWAITSISS